MSDLRDLLSAALADAGNGWSLGTFGAIAEFMRDPDEPVERSERDDWAQYVTARGGIGLHLDGPAQPLAYDTLSADGETWNHGVAFCLPLPAGGGQSAGVVTCLGPDAGALRPQARAQLLFDLGVGAGEVRFCVRTAEPELVAALRALEGKPLFGAEGAQVGALTLKFSPTRVGLSPLGRIEVYAPIPPPDGKSPDGPHTHLLPKLLSSGRTHSANIPIPAGMQPVLNLHPPSPWRDAQGMRTPFDARADERFQALLARFGLPEDETVRRATHGAVTRGEDPAAYPWPTSRRGRAQARITLRRLGQRLGAERLAPWKTLYDAGPDDSAESAPGPGH